MINRLPKARICTLYTTYGCNLNCIYCFEKYKDAGKKMPLELAKKIILKEFEEVRNSPQSEGLKIDIFGGEPLLNFSMIKDLCEWLWQQSIDQPYIFYATTNGTLLDKEKQMWFRQHKDDFVLVMSVDGDSAMQLKNRGCTNDKLAIEFVHELWPEQPLKMTISRETVSGLASGVISLLKMGYLVDSRLAQGEEWTEEDAVTYREELTKIAQFHLDNEEFIPGAIFTRYYTDVLSEQPATKFCGTGTNMRAYDVDGNSYPCHLFAPVVMGRDVREELKNIDFHKPETLIEDACLRCPVVQVCPTCLGFNFLNRGDVAKRDKRMCRMLLSEIKVVSGFQIHYYMKRKNHLSDEETVKLKAALVTYQQLKDFEFEDK